MLRRLWLAAEACDSATVQQLLSRHDIQQGCMHPDIRAAQVLHTVWHAARLGAPGQDSTTFGNGCSHGQCLVLDTVQAAALHNISHDKLLASLFALLQRGWTLGRPQLLAACSALGPESEAHEQLEECRAILSTMQYLDRFAGESLLLYGDRMDARVVHQDSVRGAALLSRVSST